MVFLVNPIVSNKIVSKPFHATREFKSIQWRHKYQGLMKYSACTWLKLDKISHIVGNKFNRIHANEIYKHNIFNFCKRHEGTGYSSSYLMYEREHQLPIDG